MDFDFTPQKHLNRDPMLNIYYRTQKLKLVGMNIMSKNDKKNALELIDNIKEYRLITKKAPHNSYCIVDYNSFNFKVELKSLDIKKKNVTISLSLLWKLFNLSLEVVPDVN